MWIQVPLIHLHVLTWIIAVKQNRRIFLSTKSPESCYSWNLQIQNSMHCFRRWPQKYSMRWFDVLDPFQYEWPWPFRLLLIKICWSSLTKVSSVPLSPLTKDGHPDISAIVSTKYPAITFGSLLVLYTFSHNIFREKPSIHLLIPNTNGLILSKPSICQTKWGPGAKYLRLCSLRLFLCGKYKNDNLDTNKNK